MVPVSWLLESVRLRRLRSFPAWVGMVPERELKERSTEVMLMSSSKNVSGMVPASELPLCDAPVRPWQIE